MIPFDEIDKRLEKLGKDRAWLANASGRKLNSLGSALAPGAAASKRSEHLQRALTDAIEREEKAQAAVVELPERITLEVSSEDYEAFNRASLAKNKTVKAWAIDELNKAAAAYHKTKAVRYETHEEWLAKQSKLRVAEEHDEAKSPRSGHA